MYKIMTGSLPFGGERVFYLMNEDKHISFDCKENMCFYNIYDLLKSIETKNMSNMDWDWSTRIKNANCIYTFEKITEIDYDLFEKRQRAGR